MPVKTSQQLAALSQASRHAPIRLIAERSELPPSQVKRIIRDLPPRRRKSP